MGRSQLTLNNITSFLNYPSCWNKLGIRLDIDKHELDRIELQYQGDIQRCMNEMLQFWLDNVNCSWSKLIRALKAIKLKNVADKLFKDLLLIRFCNQELTALNIAGHLASVAEKWYEIGTLVGVSKAKLERIASVNICITSSKMLSIWKGEGKGKCSWQQIIAALVCGSINEVVDSAPEIFHQSFKDVPKHTDQTCMSDLIKVKHKLEECESSLLYDMRRIEEWNEKLSAGLRKGIGSKLRERWRNMKIATQKLESIPMELEGCISLLKYSANVSKPVSEKLNICVTELLEFSKQLDPSISKIRPSLQTSENAIFLATIVAIIILYIILAGACILVILGGIREFLVGIALGGILWGTYKFTRNKPRILQIVAGFVSVLVIVSGVIYGVKTMCSLLVGMLCCWEIVAMKSRVLILFNIILVLLVVLGIYYGDIFGVLIGGALFGVGYALVNVVRPRLRYHLESYCLLRAVEHTINTCVKDSAIAQEKIREVKDTLIDEFIDGYTPTIHNLLFYI